VLVKLSEEVEYCRHKYEGDGCGREVWGLPVWCVPQIRSWQWFLLVWVP